MARLQHLRGFAALFAAALLAAPSWAGDPPQAMPAAVPTALVASTASTVGTGEVPCKRRDETVQLVEKVKGAVVNIHSERTVSAPSDDPFKGGPMQPQRVNGMGTGIVLDPRGYIVTNYHVVDDVQSLRVKLVDGTGLPARVVALDKDADLALIKVDPVKPLPVVPLGTAQDLMLAEQVFAIGNAYGYEHTVTAGRVSAMKRDVTLNKEVSYKSLIQTQTPINPGNSGGPLFNRLGEVVGVNVAIRAGAQNIAFAIPVDTVIARAADMLSGRRRCGSRYGLTLTDEYDRPAEDGPVRRWVTVAKVEAGSAAAEAGLRADDRIEAVGDTAVLTTVDFERGLLDRAAGGKARVKVRRGGGMVEVELAGAATSERTAAPAADAVWAKVGLRLTPVGANYVQAADKALRGGLWVADVAGGSAAAKAGLQKGDILIGLHQWETLSLDNVTFVTGHKDLPTLNPVKTFYVRDGKVRESAMSVGE